MMIVFYFHSNQNLKYAFLKNLKMIKFGIVTYIIKIFQIIMNNQLGLDLVIIKANFNIFIGGNINKSFFRIWIDEVLDNCYCNFEDHIFESGNFI